MPQLLRAAHLRGPVLIATGIALPHSPIQSSVPNDSVGHQNKPEMAVTAIICDEAAAFYWSDLLRFFKYHRYATQALVDCPDKVCARSRFYLVTRLTFIFYPCLRGARKGRSTSWHPRGVPGVRVSTTVGTDVGSPFEASARRRRLSVHVVARQGIQHYAASAKRRNIGQSKIIKL